MRITCEIIVVDSNKGEILRKNMALQAKPSVGDTIYFEDKTNISSHILGRAIVKDVSHLLHDEANIRIFAVIMPQNH
ncbi:hypothetical protein [Phyllobacterium salinisoli]|uniref:hypothetical protein n=1 Tax=Phyllobacterium salinisoli TaxID=1899321 RepID=UPI0011C036DC|nr:hypothetical protein [Phyllobacterium salinisoli]